MPRKTADIVTRRRDPETGETFPHWYQNATVQRPDGSRVRLRASCGTDDYKTARSLTAARMREITLGIDQQPQARRLTLNQALGRYWLDHVCQGTGKPQLSSAPNIRRMGADLLRLFREIVGSGEPFLHEIDDDAVARYRAKRRGEPQRSFRPKPGDDRPVPLVGPRTVNSELEHLRAVIRMARETWHFTVDPEIHEHGGGRYLQPVNFSKALFEEPDSPRNTLSIEEQARVMEWCADPAHIMQKHVGDLLQVGIWEQPRKMNLVTLDWADVDMAGRSYVIRTKSRKPGGRVQRIEMTREFFLWLANRGPKEKGRVFLRFNPNAGAPDAQGARPGAWEPFNEFKRAWNTVRKECALGAITFHQATRKTGGTRILKAGGSLADAQIALGHTDIKTTMRYLNVTAHDVRHAKDAAARFYVNNRDAADGLEASSEAQPAARKEVG